MHKDYASNNFELFETLMIESVSAYLGSSDKTTKQELIQGFKSHHLLCKGINWGCLNTETATYKDGSKWTMTGGLWF
tara:strand:+ start:6732 stop:6962 length:231 start_codon:yes stop_codon:yes gene_type:complete